MATADTEAVVERVRVGDGVELALWRHRRAGEEPPVAALVWLPAMGVPARHYRRFASALADRGVAMAVVDLRGQGESRPRCRRGMRFGYRELVEDDTPAALAWLAELEPGVPLLVGGHSLGGQVAVLAAARAPAALSGVALVAAQSVYWRAYPGRDRLRVLAGTQLAAEIATLWGWWPGHRLGFGGRQPARLMRDWARLARSPRWRLRGTAVDDDRALRELALPVLAVSIDGDRDAPPSAVDRLCAHLPAGAVRRHHVHERDGGDELTHLNWTHRAADPIAEHIAGWIGDLPPSLARRAGPDGHHTAKPRIRP